MLKCYLKAKGLGLLMANYKDLAINVYLLMMQTTLERSQQQIKFPGSQIKISKGKGYKTWKSEELVNTVLRNSSRTFDLQAGYSFRER